MPNIDLSILNQRQTPAFFADTLANRPAAGFLGRIFVSTDTFAFYRDNGTGWDLIGGPGTGTITGSGAAGQVTFFNGTSSIAGDSGLTYNDVTNALTSLGTIKATNYYVGTPSDLTRSFAAAGNANDIALWLEEYSATGTGTPDIFFRNGRGTISSKSNIQVGDSLGGIAWAGYLGSTFSDSASLSTSVVNIDSVNNHADSNVSIFQSYNSVSLIENFRVRAIDGYVVATNGGFETTGNINLFAGANSRRIIFDANNGVPRIFSFRTGNLPRWAFRVDGTESGTNTGSDLAIRRYDDTGAFVDAPLSINRASGQSTFAKKVVIENNTGDQQLQIVSTTAPSIRIDNAQTGATKRAGLGISTAANNFIQGSVDRDFCIFNGSTTASPMLFGIYDAGTSNTQEAARISSARNFLIGTTTDTGAKLQVNGTTTISGNLGIGVTPTTIGNYKVLNIQGNSTTNGGLIQLQNSDNSVQAYWFTTGTNSTLKTLSNHELILGANNTDYFYIKPTGNLLIGTTTDNGNKLQVNGNQSINGGLRFYDFIGATANYWDIYQYNDGTFRYNYNGAGGDELIIYNNGDIRASGAGKFGSAGNNAKLEVAANSGEIFRADAASGAFRIIADQTKVYLSSRVNINSIPTSPAGLSSGDIYSNAGILTIVP